MAGVVFCCAVRFVSNILCVILKLLLKVAVTITAITVGKAAAILHDMNRRISNGKKKSSGR